MVIEVPWPILKTELALVALALFCLVLDIFLPREKRGTTLANLAMIGVTGLFCNLPLQWGEFGSGFSGTYVQDGVSLCFKALFILAAFFTIFMAREYQDHLKRGQGEFVLLILFALVGMLFLASANDFLLLFVALETLSISLYIMTAYLRDSAASIEAGVKYLVMGALSTAVFLFGLSFIYGSTGSTAFAEIQSRLALMKDVPAAFVFGSVLVLASLGFKIAAVPFQLWAPDIYEGAPTPVTAFLAIGSKAAGFTALIRLSLTVMAPLGGRLTVLFAVLSALTILYGNLGAIPQTNIKRLLGYSSIGHAGYLLMGLAATDPSGREAILFYLLSYLFSTAGVFLVLVAVASHARSDEIGELAGLSKRSPMLAAAMLVSLMSLAGVPPLGGFFAKFYLLWASVKSGLLWLAVIGVVNVVTSLYYYLKVVQVMYMDEPTDTHVLSVSFDHRVVQYFAMFGVVLLGVFQGPFVRIAHNAFAYFVK
jgi:NADH-quinone oxidoreductase subunit N